MGQSEDLIRLVYELLDAHDDTARIAHKFGPDGKWRRHLDYLRDLQRVGRELLAAASPQVDRQPPRWPRDDSPRAAVPVVLRRDVDI
jgi:hypothetical protein